MVMHFFIWTIYLHVILGKTNPDFLSILSFCLCISSVNCFATLCDRSESSLAFLTPLQAILFDIDGTLCDSDPTHYNAFREMLQEVLFKISCMLYLCLITSTDIAIVPQIGFNGGVPITEEFFIKNISGMHNEELCSVLLPNWDLQRARKFMDDKEAFFRR